MCFYARTQRWGRTGASWRAQLGGSLSHFLFPSVCHHMGVCVCVRERKSLTVTFIGLFQADAVFPNTLTLPVIVFKLSGGYSATKLCMCKHIKLTCISTITSMWKAKCTLDLLNAIAERNCTNTCKHEGVWIHVCTQTHISLRVFRSLTQWYYLKLCLYVWSEYFKPPVILCGYYTVSEHRQTRWK